MKHPGGRPPNKTSKTWVDCKPQCFICSLNFNKITELNIVLENKIHYVQYFIRPSCRYYKSKYMWDIPEEHSQFFCLPPRLSACSICRTAIRKLYLECKFFKKIV